MYQVTCNKWLQAPQVILRTLRTKDHKPKELPNLQVGNGGDEGGVQVLKIKCFQQV